MNAQPSDPRMRPRKVHHLKTYSQPFWLVKHGYKTFEYRKHDRAYFATNLLHLQEYNPETDKYSGYDGWYEVTYVLYAKDAPPEFGIPQDYCIMSIKEHDITQPDAMFYWP